MATGFGIDPTITNGIITSGTTSDDIQRITGALFNPGVIQMSTITTSISQMSYSISNGVVAITMGSGFRVLTPYPPTILTVATNSTGSARVDKIYVTQNTPATNGNSNVEIKYTSGDIPARSVQIGTMTVPAGATRTSGAIPSGNLDFSVPYGTSGRVLYRYTDTTMGYISGAPRSINGAFYLPTDRTVNIDVLTTCDLEDSSNPNSVYTRIYIDGASRTTFSTGRLSSWAQTDFNSIPITLAAGAHTITFTRDPVSSLSANKVKLVYMANQFPGTIYTVRDAGVID